MSNGAKLAQRGEIGPSSQHPKGSVICVLPVKVPYELLPRYQAPATQKHPCTQAPLHTSTPAHKHPCTQAPLHTSTPATQKHPCTQAPLHTSTPAHKHPCTQAPLHTSTPAHKHPCTLAPLHTSTPATRTPVVPGWAELLCLCKRFVGVEGLQVWDDLRTLTEIVYLLFIWIHVL